jgi:hypothetical protein
MEEQEIIFAEGGESPSWCKAVPRAVYFDRLNLSG